MFCSGILFMVKMSGMKALEFICRSPRFKKQLEEMRPRLYKVSYSWTHSHDISDDLVQETIVKALKNASALRDINAIHGWLFKILNNCWHDYLRKQKYTEDIDECIFTDDETPERLHEQQNITDIVQHAIKKLPQGQCQVITLVDLEGFSYAEVAEIIGIPIGTVMSRLNRARKTLSKKLLDLKENSIFTQSKSIRLIK